MWSFVGHSVLQCFTGGTWIDYRLAASGDLPEYMEVWPEEKIWKIPESRRWYHRAPLLRPRIVPLIIFSLVIF